MIISLPKMALVLAGTARCVIFLQVSATTIVASGETALQPCIADTDSCSSTPESSIVLLQKRSGNNDQLGAAGKHTGMLDSITNLEEDDMDEKEQGKVGHARVGSPTSQSAGKAKPVEAGMPAKAKEKPLGGLGVSSGKHEVFLAFLGTHDVIVQGVVAAITYLEYQGWLPPFVGLLILAIAMIVIISTRRKRDLDTLTLPLITPKFDGDFASDGTTSALRNDTTQRDACAALARNTSISKQMSLGSSLGLNICLGDPGLDASTKDLAFVAIKWDIEPHRQQMVLDVVRFAGEADANDKEIVMRLRFNETGHGGEADGVIIEDAAGAKLLFLRTTQAVSEEGSERPQNHRRVQLFTTKQAEAATPHAQEALLTLFRVDIAVAPEESAADRLEKAVEELVSSRDSFCGGSFLAVARRDGSEDPLFHVLSDVDCQPVAAVGKQMTDVVAELGPAGPPFEHGWRAVRVAKSGEDLLLTIAAAVATRKLG